MSGWQVRLVCASPPEAARLLQQAVSRFGLSARGHDRVLKVACTIGDAAQCGTRVHLPYPVSGGEGNHLQ
jgi:predicted ATPase with chaperone activity